MERYTIRILYRDTENPGKIVGVVEADGAAGKKGFVDVYGLLQIMNEMVGVTGREKSGRAEYRTEGLHENPDEISNCF